MSDPGDRSAASEDLIEQLETEKEELQRIREETERLHHRFAALYEDAPVGYLVLNPQFIVIQANTTARRFLDARSLRLGRSALGPLLASESQREYFAALKRVRQDGEGATAVVRIDQTEGAELWLQLRAAATRDDAGEIREYRITLENVTERIEAQRAAEMRQREVEELLEYKEVLLREIHHRVKNDFHLVSSFLSLQSSGTKNPEVKNALADARRRVGAMVEAYRVLHDQSQYTRADLAPLLRGVSDAFRTEVQEAEATITLYLESVEVSTKTSVSVGILLNELLTNATKYARQDNGASEITITLAKTAPDTFELSVADDGPGFPPEVLDGRRRGFGLDVATALTEQHGGGLALSNGKGAVATVSMKID